MLYSKQGVKCGYGVLQFNAVVESNIYARHLYERLGIVQLGTIPSISDYDTIYIGYPIWWGDLPMVCYTFLEKHDLSGKTIVPFCTHEGSGLSGTDGNIKKLYKNVTMKKALVMTGRTAQNNRSEAEKQVDEWLKK